MRNLKVFLVEDDELYSMVLAQKLKVIGSFFVSTFETGEAAIENLEEGRPDIIILDYSLPGINGLETLIEMKKIDQDSKVIFLSGVDDEATIKACLDAGAYEFIKKDKDVAVKVYTSIVRIMEEAEKKKKKGFLRGLFGKLSD